LKKSTVVKKEKKKGVSKRNGKNRRTVQSSIIQL
jgi:hypothetical protein